MRAGVVVVDLRRRPRRHRMHTKKKHEARAKLMVAQGGICAHCEEPFPEAWEPGEPESPTIEHVVPRALGGRSEFSNLLLKHKACNEACGCRPPSRRDRKWLAIVAERVAEASA